MKQLLNFLALSLLASCTKTQDIPAKFANLQLNTSSICATPEAFGAVANDTADDRAALQQAIDAATAPEGPKCVELAPGKYYVTRDPALGASHAASLRIKSRVTMNCRGATLAMQGSGIKPGTTEPAAWYLIAISNGAHDVVLDQCSLDGSERVETEEQTHLVQVEHSRNVTVQGGTMNLPAIARTHGGDCVRLLGTAENRVEKFAMRDVVAPHCDRSLLGIQRGVNGVLVERVVTSLVGDQVIDMEPTSTTWGCAEPIISDVTIRDNLFLRGDVAQGSSAISVVGLGCAPAARVRVVNNVIEGGLFILDVDDVLVEKTNLRNKETSNEAPLYAFKRVKRLVVRDSTIERVGPDGPAVYATEANGALPTDVTLDGVTIIQRTRGTPISTVSLARLKVLDTKIINASVSADKFAVHARQLAQPVSVLMADVTLQGTFAGPAKGGGATSPTPTIVRVQSAGP